nr:unnamed protein product [Digitaria exilis]
MPSCLLVGVAPRPPPAALRLLLRRRMASSGGARAFQLRLNPLTGDSEWLVVDEAEEAPAAPNHHKQLLAATSYLDMLNDAARNRAYRRAIDATVTDPNSRVLDIGAGTGLLSMMAARASAAVGGRGTVSACEAYLPMGKLTRRVLRANGMENKVKVFHKRSDELRVGVELDSRADILVSEILDSELLGEGLIPTLQHAHDELLVKNPKTVPYRATTYGVLVESTFLWKMHDLHSSEANAEDGVWLTPGGKENILSVKLQQHAMQCDALEDEIRLMSERSSPTCIVADDSVFLALVVSSLSPSSKVIAMLPGLRDKGFNYLQAVADANNLSTDRIKVIGRKASSLTMSDLEHEKVNLIVGEPFYHGSEGMLPWQNLRFWFE